MKFPKKRWEKIVNVFERLNNLIDVGGIVFDEDGLPHMSPYLIDEENHTISTDNEVHNYCLIDEEDVSTTTFKDLMDNINLYDWTYCYPNELNTIEQFLKG